MNPIVKTYLTQIDQGLEDLRQALADSRETMAQQQQARAPGKDPFQALPLVVFHIWCPSRSQAEITSSS